MAAQATRGEDEIVDEILVIEAQVGDGRCLELLIQRWHGRVRAMAGARVDRADVDDLCQDVWLAIARGLPRLRDPGNFGAWAAGIVRRRAADRARKGARERRARAAAPNVQQTGGHDEPLAPRDDLARAMLDLSADQRAIVLLFYRDGLGVEQIGRIAGIPPGTVKSRLFTARRALRRSLERAGMVGGDSVPRTEGS